MVYISFLVRQEILRMHQCHLQELQALAQHILQEHQDSRHRHHQVFQPRHQESQLLHQGLLLRLIH